MLRYSVVEHHNQNKMGSISDASAVLRTQVSRLVIPVSFVVRHLICYMLLNPVSGFERQLVWNMFFDVPGPNLGFQTIPAGCTHSFYVESDSAVRNCLILQENKKNGKSLWR